MSNRPSQIIYGRRTKRITLQRALVGKISYFPEKVTYKDVILLFDNILWLQDKCTKDSDFQKKFGLYLKVLAYILKNMNLKNSVISDRQIMLLSKKFNNNLKGFSFEKRNVHQPLKQMLAFVEIRFYKPAGVEKKKLPPERYIGIGYRDKGSAKKPWLDGSPSWQEIASAPIREVNQ